MFALTAPGAWAHGGVMSAADHAAEDAVAHSPAQEQALDAHTRAVSAPQAKEAATEVAGMPQDVGQWGPVVNWPVVGVHVALLPNGKVLAYDSIGDNATESYPLQDHTRATVWDPATGSQTEVDVGTGFNIFCSGLAHLVDGRMFIAGGNKDQQLNGIIQTHIFDPTTNLWSLGPNMLGGRWYPTVTPLNNGEMLITSGRVDTPEVRTLAGNLRPLNNAVLSLPLYPWMDVAPNGQAFYSGPDQTLRSLDTTGSGSWQTFQQRDTINRDYGSHALYDIGKMLIAGGGPSTADARVVDLNGATPQVSPTAPMAYGRRQFNLTVLADGTVLSTGGNSSGASLVDLNAGVYPAELWDPATGQWRTLASMQVTRQYHSTALLLPDGRVLSAGGGICGLCDQVGYLAKNAEIFSPPYLFQADGTLAPRPVIDDAPSSTDYGGTMQITTANPASISKVALVRLGAVTHSDNMEQRYIPLSFSTGATSITANTPTNANIAPPGFYMLFIIDANGVPSVAKILSVGTPADTTPPTVGTVTPTNGAANVSLGTSVSATFNESISGASVTATSFVLRDGSGNAVAASVSASGSTATLQPNAALATSTTYTATLLGGSSGIKDLAGNALASDYSWSFTTAAGDTTAPTVVSVTPTGGASSVSLGTSVSASFSEAISAASVTGTSFVLRDGSGNAVAASVSASGSTATLQPNAALAPGTTYTATLLSGSSGIKDLAGNALASDFTWSFTTAAGTSCPCSLWAPSATPQTAADPDTTAYELGVRFKSDAAGFISGIRFYKGSTNTGTHVGHLWTSTGTQLASATFTNETATGWQQVSFSSPVAISANTVYVASYTDPNGHFALDRPYFTNAYDNAPLHAPADGNGGGNGVFAVGSGFPTESYQATNYWVDVVFVTSVSDTTAPTVSAVTPVNSATNVSLGTSVSATFSEAISAASVTGTSFVLRDGGGNAVAASVSASGSTATLQPNAALAPTTTYTATLLGGSSGIKDLAGNALASNFSWSFTTATPDTTPPTVVSVTPVNGATNVSLGTSVSPTFSEAISAASVTGTSFVLRDGGGNAVAASVSASGSTATLRPNANLAPSTTYTATLLGGSSGIKDLAGNALASNFSWSFTTATVDQTPPSSVLSFPAASGSYNASHWTAGCSPAGLCGSASDTGSSVQKVEVSIRRVSTNKYWTGTGYTGATERWFVATGTTSWNYALASSTFPGAGSYSVRVRATDTSGNIETPATTTFVYDNANPTSTLTFPVASASYRTASWNAGCAAPGMCGTASDAVAGVQKVEISIRRGTGNYWNGTSFSSASEVFFPATGTTAWSFSFPASQFPASANYTIRLRATDNAGNVQSPSSRKITFAP